MEKRKVRVFFTMVNHPVNGWMRVGHAYNDKKAASEWIPFVRSAWRGLHTKVSSCTLTFNGSHLTPESQKKLLCKFSMTPPDGYEKTNGERQQLKIG